MSKEIMEKKLYPSQINSKTISARIPVQDYVNFLNESISLGISLNDFLLRKIYTDNSNEVGNIENNNLIVISKEDCTVYSEHENIYDYFKDNFDENFEFSLSKIDVMDLLLAVKRKQQYIESHINKKTASLEDVKIQLSILINNKYKHYKERQEVKNELFDLLDELS